MLNRVVHFEFVSQQPELLLHFYTKVFGWQSVRGEDGYTRLITGAAADVRGINGAIVRSVNEHVPTVATINTIQVVDLMQSLDEVVRHGGRVLSEVIRLPAIGKFAYCEDPEGRAFGCIEYESQNT